MRGQREVECGWRGEEERWCGGEGRGGVEGPVRELLLACPSNKSDDT